MSKIQDVPFITKVIDTLSDELKSGLYDLIDGKEKTPVFRSLVNNNYAITETNDKGKVQFVTLETLRGNYTGYLAYNSVYCVLIAFKGNTQALDMLNINVAKHTLAFVNESLSILELRVELEDGKEGVTPTDLKSTNNNVHLAKGTTAIGEGVNVKTINGETLLGSGNIVVGDTGTVDGALDDDSVNPVQNKVVTEEFEKIELQNYPFAKTAFQGTLSDINFLPIKNALVDIQLFGVEEDEDYYLKSYLVNFNGRTLVEIARVSDKVSVASFDTYSDVYSTSKFERYNLTMLNNSGVSGYIVFNPYLFTTSYYFTNYPEYTTLDKRCLHENRTQKYIGLVNNLICIGDSLTQGYISSTYLHTNNSYPAELSRMINGVADNLGASGFTAVSMYNQILAHPNWYDFASYSYMILWLGSNAGLTTTESQEAYQNIITKALTENPNIKIFLCNVFSVDGATTNVEATNTFINSLGYPVIDMNVLPFNSKHVDNTLYHPFDDTHFGDYGYFRVAEYILSSICKHISTNRSSYNLIGGSKENQPLKHFAYYEEMTDNFSVASGANITIGNQRTFIIGNLVICNIRVNASETIPAGTQILNVSRYPTLKSVNANAVSYSGSYPVQFSTDGKVTTLGNGLGAGDSDIEISFYS